MYLELGGREVEWEWQRERVGRKAEKGGWLGWKEGMEQVRREGSAGTSVGWSKSKSERKSKSKRWKMRRLSNPGTCAMSLEPTGLRLGGPR